MTSFAFIHTGDLHLDSPLTSLGEIEDPRVDEIRAAGRRAFDDLVDIAIAENVDAFLIAGDLWDGSWSDVSVGLHVQAKANELARAGIRTLAILGNHDAESRVTEGLRHLTYLDVFPADRAASIDIGPAIIHGRSFDRPKVTDNIALTYPDAVPGRINVGLLHTALEGDARHARYAPCSPADLSAKGYDYWGLGHIHERKLVQEKPAHQGGTIAYCGVLQGRDVGETGIKGAYLGRIDGDGLALTPLDLHRVAWFAEDVPMPREGDEEAALREAARAFSATVPAELRLAVVRYTLSGATARHFAIATKTRALLDVVRSQHEGSRVLPESVRAATIPAGDEAVQIAHGFDADLAAAADDSAVLAEARETVEGILGRLPFDVREEFRAAFPALQRIEDEGGLDALLRDAADQVARRLEEKS